MSAGAEHLGESWRVLRDAGQETAAQGFLTEISRELREIYRIEGAEMLADHAVEAVSTAILPLLARRAMLARLDRDRTRALESLNEAVKQIENRTARRRMQRLVERIRDQT